jgi:Na+-translocating ferredoxin:NAD+ oxidoreductase RNF subunit RnfB
MLQLIGGIIIVLSLGIIFAVLLMYIRKKSPRKSAKEKQVREIEKMLPGLNCGVCGYPLCTEYAQAVAGSNEGTGRCSPGGERTKRLLFSLADKRRRYRRRKKTAYNFGGVPDGGIVELGRYDGIDDCIAINMMFPGRFSGRGICLGKGSCISVCPENALYYLDNGMPQVNPERCSTCGNCIDICPTGVIRFETYEKRDPVAR